ncbi:protein GVQW3 [Trichonephila clavipes]|nr:protein GVQW3 [Trichonephila clavipes]
MNEQKINVKFCFKLGKRLTEIYLMLVRAYGDQALSTKCVYERFARYREGRESVSDNPRSKRPVAPVIAENIEKLSKLISKDRSIIVRMITGW